MKPSELLDSPDKWFPAQGLIMALKERRLKKPERARFLFEGTRPESPLVCRWTLIGALKTCIRQTKEFWDAWYLIESKGKSIFFLDVYGPYSEILSVLREAGL